MSGLGGRILVAVPLAVVAIAAVLIGGWPVVVVAVAVGIVAVHEFATM